jgi:hypothetical protein
MSERLAVNLGLSAVLLFIGVTLLPAAIVKSGADYQNSIFRAPLEQWLAESSTLVDDAKPHAEQDALDALKPPVVRKHRLSSLAEFDATGYKKVQNMYEKKMMTHEDEIAAKIAKWNAACKAVLLKHLADFPDFGPEEQLKSGSGSGSDRKSQIHFVHNNHKHLKTGTAAGSGSDGDDDGDEGDWHPALRGTKPTLALCKLHFGIRWNRKKIKKRKEPPLPPPPHKYKSVGVRLSFII